VYHSLACSYALRRRNGLVGEPFYKSFNNTESNATFFRASGPKHNSFRSPIFCSLWTDQMCQASYHTARCVPPTCVVKVLLAFRLAHARSKAISRALQSKTGNALSPLPVIEAYPVHFGQVIPTITVVLLIVTVIRQDYWRVCVICHRLTLRFCRD
jgi:hypothetical protein